MGNLISPSDLCEDFKQTSQKIGMLLASSGLKPVYENDRIKLYDRELASAAVKKFLDAEAKKTAPAVAAAVDLKPVQDQIGDMHDTMEERFQATINDVEKLLEQNRLLLRYIDELKMLTTTKMDAMQASIDMLGHTPDPEIEAQVAKVIEAPAVAKAPVPQAKRKTVVIISLLPGQQAEIEREFKECFNLRMFTADQTASRSFEGSVKGCDYAIVMTKFVSHKAEDVLKAAGVQITRVTGGMTMLRNKLTDFYIESAN